LRAGRAPINDGYARGLALLKLHQISSDRSP
jgi:hypothetical protein